MFAFSTLEIGAASVLLACDLIGDAPTAESVLAIAPGARTRECAEQLRAACAARGLTPEALHAARANAPDGPPATTSTPPAGTAGPEDDGIRAAESGAHAQR